MFFLNDGGGILLLLHAEQPVGVKRLSTLALDYLEVIVGFSRDVGIDGPFGQVSRWRVLLLPIFCLPDFLCLSPGADISIAFVTATGRGYSTACNYPLVVIAVEVVMLSTLMFFCQN